MQSRLVVNWKKVTARRLSAAHLPKSVDRRGAMRGAEPGQPQRHPTKLSRTSWISEYDMFTSSQ
jgi:hypothetical protein